MMLHNKYVPVAIDADTNDVVRDPKTGFAIRQPYSTGGEMLVNVPSEEIFAGYYGNDSATQKKYERNVFRKGDLYYRTGDALRRLDDGRWYFVDRLGDTFRWKSENVSTNEVGNVLGSFPGVVEAIVYGVLLPHHDGRAGCAAIYIDPAKRDSFDWAGLLQYAREKLPKYAVPVFVRVVREMRPFFHNYKPTKLPLRDDGVDPAKVEESGDRLMWVKPGGSTYEHFGLAERNELDGGRAKL
jgi:acyl-CoA synthetase (AMP-forming)/AMP-acid ligase II